jgi:hypothetical protein
VPQMATQFPDANDVCHGETYQIGRASHSLWRSDSRCRGINASHY